MNIPDSMKDELGAWNNGRGIDLESWVSCEGNFSLAVGYSTIFCPKFVEFEDYILAFEEMSKENVQRIRDWEKQEGITKKSLEWVVNHLHIADLHHNGCEDLTVDKVIFLGNVLKEIYEARLQYLFPDKPCNVEFYQPEDNALVDEYQLSFWQKKHELENT